MNAEDIKKFRENLKKRAKSADALIESIDENMQKGWRRSNFFKNTHRSYLNSLDENGNVRGE